MNIELNVIDEIIKKHGSRKGLIAMIGMYFISCVVIPEDQQWLKAFQIGGFVLLSGMFLLSQWNLDKEKNGTELEKTD